MKDQPKNVETHITVYGWDKDDNVVAISSTDPKVKKEIASREALALSLAPIAGMES